MAGEVQVEEGVVYGRGGSRELKCDVYIPGDGSGLRPAVVLVHGGGWTSGAPFQMRGIAMRLAEDGFVCMAPEYRLLGEAPWPAQIQDVKAAIRWLRAGAADLRVDASAIAAQGNSAGAHLVLLAAGTAGDPAFAGEGGNPGVDESIAAVVATFAPTVFYRGETRPRGASPASSLLAEDASDEVMVAASPVSHVSPAFPPTFLQHGTDDKVVPPSATMVMYEALVRARVPAELHMYAGQPHGFIRQPLLEPLACAEISNFLRRYLPTAEAIEPVAAARA